MIPQGLEPMTFEDALTLKPGDKLLCIVEKKYAPFTRGNICTVEDVQKSIFPRIKLVEGDGYAYMPASFHHLKPVDRITESMVGKTAIIINPRAGGYGKTYTIEGVCVGAYVIFEGGWRYAAREIALLEPTIEGSCRFLDSPHGEIASGENPKLVWDESKPWQAVTDGAFNIPARPTADDINHLCDVFRGVPLDECGDVAPTKKEIEGIHRQTVAEFTHSMTLRFPNGDTVVIPEPNAADGWTWEEDIEQDAEQWPPMAGNWTRDDKIRTSDTDDLEITHDAGRILLDEYARRLWDQEPFCLNIRRWIRVTQPTKPDEPETYEAVRNYPLLTGGKK